MTAADLAITRNSPLWLWLRRNKQALRWRALNLPNPRQARLVVEVGRHKGELSSVADLVDSFLDTPQMEACLKRFGPIQTAPLCWRGATRRCSQISKRCSNSQQQPRFSLRQADRRPGL